ncbi:MAG: DUF1131 family protein [Parvibaculum sp.]|nr:DUF1131 family protein [Parvibaculum sp.]
MFHSIRLFVVAMAISLAACDASEEIRIGEKGVGPITIATPHDAEAIAALLPGWNVATTFVPRHGEDYRFIVAGRGQAIDMEFASAGPEATTVNGVSVFSPDIPDENGVAVGAVFSDVFSSSAEPRCRRLSDELSGNISCHATGLRHVFYEFSGTWRGSDISDPLSVAAADWKIVAIHWTHGAL